MFLLVRRRTAFFVPIIGCSAQVGLTIGAVAMESLAGPVQPDLVARTSIVCPEFQAAFGASRALLIRSCDVYVDGAQECFRIDGGAETCRRAGREQGAQQKRSWTSLV